MIKYKTLKKGLSIEEVEVEQATDKLVWIQGKGAGTKHRMFARPRSSDTCSYHDTIGQALEAIRPRMEKVKREIEILDMSLLRALTLTRSSLT